MLHQAVMNICGNAVQSLGNAAGQVEVEIALVNMTLGSRTALLSSGRTVGDLKPGTYVRIMISDDGPGISADALNHLFEPYFTTKKEGGTGLGLRIVSRFVTEYSGAVRVESDPGRRTQVSIYLPFVKAQKPTDMHSAKTSGANGNIVILDDEKLICEVLSQMLETLGYQSEAFADPVRALSYLEEFGTSVDLVITDQSMPTMGGFEFAEQARALHPGLKFVLISGFGHAGAHAEYTQFFSGLLRKPFSLEELSEVVHKILES